MTTLAIVHPIPETPTLGSNSPVCIGQTLTLTSTPVPGGTYGWTGPNSFVSGMQNPTIPNVTAAAAGNYELTVSANGCSATPAQISVSTIDVPPMPDAINGPGSFCENETGVVYSISPVAGATSYTWSVPDGATITNGQGTTSITVTFVSNSGNVMVTADNTCGSSMPRSLTVVRLDPPATPGTISGDTTPCANSSGHVYSIAAVEGATSYTWTMPPNATIQNGQGTTSITVTFGATSGTIVVAAVNDCGTSADRTLSISLQSAGSGSQTFNPTTTGRTGSVQTFTVPTCVTTVTIEAWGAQGGNQGGANRPTPTPGANGARMRGDFALTPGATLNILVGQRGTTGGREGGGGGGTFVTDVANSPLIVAAGGGGSSEDSLGTGGSTGTNGLSGLGSSGATGGSAGSGGGLGNGGSGGGLLGDGASQRIAAQLRRLELRQRRYRRARRFRARRLRRRRWRPR